MRDKISLFERLRRLAKLEPNHNWQLQHVAPANPRSREAVHLARTERDAKLLEAATEARLVSDPMVPPANAKPVTIREEILPGVVIERTKTNGEKVRIGRLDA